MPDPAHYTLDHLLGEDPGRKVRLKDGHVAEEELRQWEAIIADRLEMPPERVRCREIGFAPDGKRLIAVDLVMRYRWADRPVLRCAIAEVRQ